MFRAARAIKHACLAESRETSLKANKGNNRNLRPDQQAAYMPEL